jgi:hypothetical protein
MTDQETEYFSKFRLTTFGNSKAAIILMKEVDKLASNKEKKKVFRVVHNYWQLILSLKKTPQPLKSWAKKSLEKSILNIKLPDNVRTFVINVLLTKLRNLEK